VKIRYTLPALADLNAILDYISESSARAQGASINESNGSLDCS
jgi:hypothetical protein